MSDLLNIGSNALLAFQRALDTTGQNMRWAASTEACIGPVPSLMRLSA